MPDLKIPEPNKSRLPRPLTGTKSAVGRATAGSGKPPKAPVPAKPAAIASEAKTSVAPEPLKSSLVKIHQLKQQLHNLNSAEATQKGARVPAVKPALPETTTVISELQQRAAKSLSKKSCDFLERSQETLKRAESDLEYLNRKAEQLAIETGKLPAESANLHAFDQVSEKADSVLKMAEKFIKDPKEGKIAIAAERTQDPVSAGFDELLKRDQDIQYLNDEDSASSVGEDSSSEPVSCVENPTEILSKLRSKYGIQSVNGDISHFREEQPSRDMHVKTSSTKDTFEVDKQFLLSLRRKYGIDSKPELSELPPDVTRPPPSTTMAYQPPPPAPPMMSPDLQAIFTRYMPAVSAPPPVMTNLASPVYASPPVYPTSYPPQQAQLIHHPYPESHDIQVSLGCPVSAPQPPPSMPIPPSHSEESLVTPSSPLLDEALIEKHILRILGRAMPQSMSRSNSVHSHVTESSAQTEDTDRTLVADRTVQTCNQAHTVSVQVETANEPMFAAENQPLETECDTLSRCETVSLIVEVSSEAGTDAGRSDQPDSVDITDVLDDVDTQPSDETSVRSASPVEEPQVEVDTVPRVSLDSEKRDDGDDVAHESLTHRKSSFMMDQQSRELNQDKTSCDPETSEDKPSNSEQEQPHESVTDDSNFETVIEPKIETMSNSNSDKTDIDLSKVDLQSYFEKDPLLRILFERMEQCQKELESVTETIDKMRDQKQNSQ